MDIFELIIQKIDERQKDLVEDLSNGAAKDYEEYRYICGTIYGMGYVKMYIKDLKQNLEDSDD